MVAAFEGYEMKADDLLRFISKAVAPLSRRVYLMIARGVVRAIGDSEGLQRADIEVMRGEIKAKMERFQDYGFTSKPLAGSDALVAFLGGNREHGVVLKVDDRRYRLVGLEDGEVAIYTDEGDKIHIQRGGTILINGAAAVQINTPAVTISGTEKVVGAWACNNATPQVPASVAVATGANNTAVINQIRALLIANGQAV